MKGILLVLGSFAGATGPGLQSDSRSASGPATQPVPAIEQLLRRARELGRREDYPGAEATLREAFVLAPENPEVHRMLGALYLRAHRFGDAARAFERFLALEPAGVARCPWIGHAYHQLGELEKAQSWYGRVLEADPKNLEAKRGLALTLHKRGEEAAAEALFREVASRAEPESEALADARHYLGEILLARGDGQGAILELEKAKAEDPFGPEVAYLLARAYARAGDSARAEEERARHRLLNEHRQEVETLRERLRASPADLEAVTRIAVRLAAIGDHAGAEKTLRSAIERVPQDPSPRLSLVDFLEARGRLEESRRALEEVASLFPEAPAVFERAFRFHRARGEFDAMYRAAEAYHKLTGKAPR